MMKRRKQTQSLDLSFSLHVTEAPAKNVTAEFNNNTDVKTLVSFKSFCSQSGKVF